MFQVFGVWMEVDCEWSERVRWWIFFWRLERAWWVNGRSSSRIERWCEKRTDMRGMVWRLRWIESNWINLIAFDQDLQIRRIWRIAGVGWRGPGGVKKRETSWGGRDSHWVQFFVSEFLIGCVFFGGFFCWFLSKFARTENELCMSVCSRQKSADISAGLTTIWELEKRKFAQFSNSN